MVSRAEGTLSLDEIANYRIDVYLSLAASFRDLPPEFLRRYAELTIQELQDLQTGRLRETDLQCALTVLAAVEAAFRIDYRIRCEKKLRDPLSRKFRELYKKYELRVRLEDDILEMWKEEKQQLASLISQLKGAFKYRHYLAHGRHGFPKLGKDYDFQTVFTIADLTLTSLNLIARD